MGYAGKLVQWLKPSTRSRPRDDLAGLPSRYRPICRPGLVGMDTEAKVVLAARVLHAMGLDHAGSSKQLMYPVLSRTLTGLQAGDLEGLRRVGQAAGCTTV